MRLLRERRGGDDRLGVLHAFELVMEEEEGEFFFFLRNERKKKKGKKSTVSLGSANTFLGEEGRRKKQTLSLARSRCRRRSFRNRVSSPPFLTSQSPPLVFASIRKDDIVILLHTSLQGKVSLSLSDKTLSLPTSHALSLPLFPSLPLSSTSLHLPMPAMSPRAISVPWIACGV